MRFLALSPTLLLASICLAGTATQTDWSGGDGVLGPVIDWGEEFYTDTDINWLSSPGDVSIQLRAFSLSRSRWHIVTCYEKGIYVRSQ
jgi:hypothetical protein